MNTRFRRFAVFVFLLCFFTTLIVMDSSLRTGSKEIFSDIRRSPSINSPMSLLHLEFACKQSALSYTQYFNRATVNCTNTYLFFLIDKMIRALWLAKTIYHRNIENWCLTGKENLLASIQSWRNTCLGSCFYSFSRPQYNDLVHWNCACFVRVYKLSTEMTPLILILRACSFENAAKLGVFFFFS